MKAALSLLLLALLCSCSDSETDAGAQDAGSHPDAAQDAANLDASVPDAVPQDANTIDSGTPDSGSDSGTPDSGTTDSGTTDTGVSAAEVHLHGRFNSNGRCQWTGCGFSTRFRGTALDLEFNGGNGIYYQVEVDGVATSTFEASGSSATYRVADALPLAEHDVLIFRQSEALWWGQTQVGTFTPIGGNLIPTPPPTRRIELVGDSITAGYGNEGCPFSAATQNGYLTYGAIAARAVNAEVQILAWSGIGMAQNLDQSTTDTMPDRYGRTIATDENSTWDFSWIPDAVVINLGTNDFNSGVTPANYVSAYVQFVQRVRTNYPNALILCAVIGNYGSHVDLVITTVGDPNVKRFDLTAPNWDGCHGHPDLVSHQSMAAQLTTKLQTELNW